MPERRKETPRELPCVRYKRILMQLAADIDYDHRRAAAAVTRRMEAPDANGSNGLVALAFRETAGAQRYLGSCLEVDGHGGRALVEADTPEAQHAEQATRELAAWYGLYLDTLHVCANQALLRRAGLL
jgi:hypothetical protein